MKRYAFPLAIGFTAAMLALFSAFFSVTGLGKIFAGWPILAMASAIELGKLMVVSVLYRLWDRLTWLRFLLIPMTAIIMLITSAGVYGYMSASYEHTAAGLRTQDSQMALEGRKKESIDGKIAFYEKSIDRKEQRAIALSNLRAQQENRLDSLYAKNQTRAAKGVQSSISQADAEITKLNKEADSLSVLIGDLRGQIADVDSSMIHMESESSQGETGAIKYIARVTGVSIDSVANWFMLSIIFVFDPLAILLVIVFNIAWDKASADPVPTSGKKEEDEPEPIESLPPLEPEPVAEPEPIIAEPPVKEPQKDPVVYESNDEGDFVKNDESKKQLITKNMPSQLELYTSLLHVLYHNGRLNENDDLGDYKQIMEGVRNANIICTGEQLDEFLKKCVSLKLIRIGKKDTRRVALKKYDDALEVMRADIGGSVS